MALGLTQTIVGRGYHPSSQHQVDKEILQHQVSGQGTALLASKPTHCAWLKGKWTEKPQRYCLSQNCKGRPGPSSDLACTCPGDIGQGWSKGTQQCPLLCPSHVWAGLLHSQKEKSAKRLKINKTKKASEYYSENASTCVPFTKRHQGLLHDIEPGKVTTPQTLQEHLPSEGIYGHWASRPQKGSSSDEGKGSIAVCDQNDHMISDDVPIMSSRGHWASLGW